MAKGHDIEKCACRRGITRRGFLAAVGVGAAAVAATGAVGRDSAASTEVGSAEPIPVKLRVNGREYRLLVEPRWTLLFVLRERLGLTGTKVGCERGECGACTVLLDGSPGYACMTLPVEALEVEITTVEGLLRGEELGPAQQAFIEHDAYRGDFRCLRKGGDRCYALGGDNRYHCLFGGDGCYIVHPSDTAPALVALGASVRAVGPKGTWTLPVEKLHMPPSVDPQRETTLERGEIIAEVLLPPAPRGLRSSYRKVRARRAWDFALAGAALAVEIREGRVTGARVAMAGAAPVPWRSKTAEESLSGKALTRETAAEAAEAAVRGAEPLAHNGYKVELFRSVIAEEILRLARG